MKFLSLFAGIGGFDLGLERAGMECVGQVEYNPFCQRVLKHHWPHVKLIGDIHDVKDDSFGAVGLICGGFPCQPFSVAGKQRGTEDDRYLWPEMLRVIKAYRPSWVLGENVAGIINMELDNVLSDLESEGYETQAFIIPACAVDARHERKRVWILANSDSGKHIWWTGQGIEKNGMENKKQYANIVERSSEMVSDSNRTGFGERWGAEPVQSEQYSVKCTGERTGAIWEPEPGLGRVANGVPGRVDRLRSLGNAVVPQVVEQIGRAIMAASA